MCRYLAIILLLGGLFAADISANAQDDDYEVIESDSCVDCHEMSAHESDIAADISLSIHEGLECLDCHTDRDTIPHQPLEGFHLGLDGCATCHEDASDQYQAHGRSVIGSSEDMPLCSDCHGDHDILPSSVKRSTTHPVNLPQTCGKCHEDLDLTKKYDILIDHPIAIYQNSVHGKATQGGIYVAATCNDCHSTEGTAHKILSPGYPKSSINHFNIPATCGKCHKGIESDFWEGIHGRLVARGETDAPVCTGCHGEHGILSPDDPRSPVSRFKVAEMTCSPCHESTVLNEKYGLQSGHLTSFIDSYHGLKSKAGDTHVANCASCHGTHRILPSTDPTSTIFPANLQGTCGSCHPRISEQMAATSIHGMGSNGLRTPVADLVEKIYIIAIIVIIGMMALHWLIDLARQIRVHLARGPQIRRMRTGEVWQHLFLAVTFTVLVVSGFALRYDESFLTKLFFGHDGGFQVRGLVHRTAAVLFMLTVVWHSVYLLTGRGRKFMIDMLPNRTDFVFFYQKMRFNLGRGEEIHCAQRFSYIEKAEYWALVWGTVVMIITGIMLWVDNWIVQFLPKGVLDVSLVVHYWEAWLATLAILVWHMYAVVFHPHVYPMNPSWITGKMSEEMYKHEHPGHLEEARKDD